MADVANNFQHKYNSKLCQFGCDRIEDYVHIVGCTKINFNDSLEEKELSELYGSNILKMNLVAKKLNQRIIKRKQILEEAKSDKEDENKNKKKRKLNQTKINTQNKKIKLN